MGSTSTDNFCLKWSDFSCNLSGSLRAMRATKDFFDVTLACGSRADSQGRTLKAHRVVLASCSEFFADILRQDQNQNAYIYLRGVKMSDLKSILDFMYQGEVNVSQDELTSFLAVAEDLQIKGLTQQDHNLVPKTIDKLLSKRSGVVSPPGPAKRSRTEPEKPPDAGFDDGSNSMEEEVAFVVENEVDEEEGEEEEEEFEDTYDYEDGFAGSSEGGDGIKVDSYEVEAIPLPFGRASCSGCQKVFASMASANHHIRAYHLNDSNVNIGCKLCQKRFRHVTLFRSHINLKHSIKGVKNVVETYGLKFND